MKRDDVILVRGGGDLATGTIHRLWSAGLKVLVLEAEHPAAIRRQVGSDRVILGLSGGVDSSAVVAIMAGLSDTPVNTCSIGFDDPRFNESEFAQKVADRYRTNHFVWLYNLKY